MWRGEPNDGRLMSNVEFMRPSQVNLSYERSKRFVFGKCFLAPSILMKIFKCKNSHGIDHQTEIIAAGAEAVASADRLPG